MLWKHKNNTDVAFSILKRFYVKEKQIWKMKVMWWNIGQCHEPWCMGIEQKIEISKYDWANSWQPYPPLPAEIVEDACNTEDMPVITT